MKTIKIIDLAEKQLKDEIMPKHIRYSDEDLYFDGIAYYDEQGNNDLLDILAMTNSALTHLNDEVEIIEEEKEIKKLFRCCMESDNQEIKFCIQNINDLANKINELIDIVNELKGGKND